MTTDALLQTTDEFDDYAPPSPPAPSARPSRGRLALVGACLVVVAVCVCGILALDAGTYFAPGETGDVVDDFRVSVFGPEYKIKTPNWND